MTRGRRARRTVYALLVLAAAGCGGPEGGEVAVVNEEGTVVVAAIGDSIHAGSPHWDPDPDLRATYERVDEQSQWEYWAARKDPRLRIRNCGVWGERTDEIQKRFDACTEGADVVIVQGGINDIAQGRDVEVAAGNLEEMVRRAQERGQRVAIANVLPWNNGYPRAEAPIRELNSRIDAIGVPVLPFHDTLEDPERPGRMRDEWTSDGDHPSVEGYRRLGELAFRLP